MSSDRQMHTSSRKKNRLVLNGGAAQNVELLVVDNVTCRRVSSHSSCEVYCPILLKVCRFSNGFNATAAVK